MAGKYMSALRISIGGRRRGLGGGARETAEDAWLETGSEALKLGTRKEGDFPGKGYAFGATCLPVSGKGREDRSGDIVLQRAFEAMWRAENDPIIEHAALSSGGGRFSGDAMVRPSRGGVGRMPDEGGFSSDLRGRVSDPITETTKIMARRSLSGAGDPVGAATVALVGEAVSSTKGGRLGAGASSDPIGAMTESEVQGRMRRISAGPVTRANREYIDAGTEGADINRERQKHLDKFLNVALGQLRYHEKDSREHIYLSDKKYDGKGNWTKYGEWYGINGGPGAPWCAMFVDWCAEVAGVPQELIPHAKKDEGKGYSFASTGEYKRWYRERGRYAPSGMDYVPQPGDLIFFDGHIGIVAGYDEKNKRVYTVEGNTETNDVKCRRYGTNDERIKGYGINRGFGR